jgi:hypothetical protein
MLRHPVREQITQPGPLEPECRLAGEFLHEQHVRVRTAYQPSNHVGLGLAGEQIAVKTRSTGPAAGGWRRGSARGPTAAVRAAPAAAAAAAGPAPRSSSALTQAPAVTCGVNDSNGTAHASAERRRSAPVSRAAAQPASAPATAHSTRRDGIGP